MLGFQLKTALRCTEADHQPLKYIPYFDWVTIKFKLINQNSFPVSPACVGHRNCNYSVDQQFGTSKRW